MAMTEVGLGGRLGAIIHYSYLGDQIGACCAQVSLTAIELLGMSVLTQGESNHPWPWKRGGGRPKFVDHA